MNRKFKIKTGDNVVVIAGKDKGKTGNILSVIKHAFNYNSLGKLFVFL